MAEETGYDALRLKEAEDTISRLKRDIEFVARWSWRTDPPNSNHALSDAERLSAIKYHPTIKSIGDEMAKGETDGNQ